LEPGLVRALLLDTWRGFLAGKGGRSPRNHLFRAGLLPESLSPLSTGTIRHDFDLNLRGSLLLLLLTYHKVQLVLGSLFDIGLSWVDCCRRVLRDLLRASYAWALVEVYVHRDHHLRLLRS